MHDAQCVIETHQIIHIIHKMVLIVDSEEIIHAAFYANCSQSKELGFIENPSDKISTFRADVSGTKFARQVTRYGPATDSRVHRERWRERERERMQVYRCTHRAACRLAIPLGVCVCQTLRHLLSRGGMSRARETRCVETVVRAVDR